MAIEPIVNPHAPRPERLVQRQLVEQLLHRRLLSNDVRAASEQLAHDPKAIDRRATKVERSSKSEGARTLRLRHNGRDPQKNLPGGDRGGGHLDILV